MKFELPPIRSLSHLAELLELTPRELHWLANHITHRSDFDANSKHYRSRWIRKRSGGWRLIEAPRSKLRFAQQILLEQIFNQVPPHPFAFGFSRNKNVLDFAKPHLRQPVCWRLDLKDFFASVTTGRVFGLLLRCGYSHDVAHTISLLTTVETCPRILSIEHPNASLKVQSTVYQKRHLPQGAPTSPAIANLCAYGLDVRLSGLARSLGGVCYTRYADDMMFSGDGDLARQSKRLLSVVGAIVLDEGFDLNFRKTRLMRSSQQQAAAGIVVNRKLNIKRKEYDKLKATLHNCIRHGPASQNHDDHPAFRQHLDGRVQWVERLNQRKGEKLRILLSQIRWN